TFKSMVSQKPRTDMILPLSGLQSGGKKEAKAEGMGYLFHPDPKTILTEVLPLVVRMSIFTAMLDNCAGEHAARRLAMKNATDAADDMIKMLTRQYNRARQSKITQEIAEIVGGANAL
ncbi:MAG: F0F1 ATP synthase subunit gamma, partial [Planctomycetes bacterium]|nr:F0F1 ATP synthase subunit gamma [Planctomycetota bacterium]